MTDFRTNPRATARGIRNNNPFNLQKTNNAWIGKIKGTDPRFETFNNVINGVRAGIIDIVGDIARDKKQTLSLLFQEFAPKHENDTANYINVVSREIGTGPQVSLLNSSGQIPATLLFKLAKAIIRVENGPTQAALISDSDIWQGILAASTSNSVGRRYIFVDNRPVMPTLNQGKNPRFNDMGIVVILALFLFIYLFSKLLNLL
jgi:hypothetical protein